MVERVNGIFKNNTILSVKYPNKTEIENDMLNSLCLYNLHRRHGSTRKKLSVTTPIKAM
jgi:CRISPR/Cas system CSM-associated protein Csm4 (group 5 of RAMP superfamily)